MPKRRGRICKRKETTSLDKKFLQCSKTFRTLPQLDDLSCHQFYHNPVFYLLGIFLGIFWGRVYRPKCNAMAKFLKVSLMIFLIEMSIEVSTSMYDISRGDIDMYSYTILKPKEAKKCGGNYCSCSELKTFIYQIGAQKGNCVKDTDIRLQSSEYNEYLLDSILFMVVSHLYGVLYIPLTIPLPLLCPQIKFQNSNTVLVLFFLLP